MHATEGLMQPPALREGIAVRGEMIVSVDEAGKQGEAREIDDVDMRWPGDGLAWSYSANPSVIDEYRSIRHRCSASAVNQSGSEEQLHNEPRFLLNVRLLPPTVHFDDTARDITRSRGSQKQHHCRYLLGATRAAQRHRGGHRGLF